ncbi:MAG: NAD(P)/FAD-dependent oxidoreductase [Deltaproteobacteria bacterium]|nr:NAD(P)/FAD-dependent oxidoreductase [Deltaproteobacteria bacterium]
MKSDNKYCIIGAGYCGLGIAKAFQDYGIEFDWFEKNEALGGNWLNGVYDSTHIISSRDTTGYGDFPMPKTLSDFPSRAEILAYLESYAERFNLVKLITFNTAVESVRPLDPSGMTGWKVRLAGGEERTYRGVVVANGHHWDKRIPTYPGEFTGKTLHSKDYKRPVDFAGSRVLVVGAGNSGCDIAVEAASQGLESYMSMRRGYYFLPKTIFGVPTAEIDRPGLPTFAQKFLLKAALKLIHGDNEKYGLQKPDHELFDHHPIVNSQLLYYIRHGKVRPKVDIDRFEGKKVWFKASTSSGSASRAAAPARSSARALSSWPRSSSRRKRWTTPSRSTSRSSRSPARACCSA